MGGGASTGDPIVGMCGPCPSNGATVLDNMRCSASCPGLFKQMKSLALFLILAGSLFAEDYDLYILAGQSNRDGRGDAKNLPAELRKESDKVIIFYRNPVGASDGWTKLAPGYSFAPRKSRTLPTSTFGPEIGFTQAMLKADPEQALALIKGSRGATNLRADWAPGEAGKPDSQGECYRMLIESVGLDRPDLFQRRPSDGRRAGPPEHPHRRLHAA